jgi:hypothetical protein
MGGLNMSSLIIAAGQQLAASGTRDAFGALSDDLVAEGHPPVRVNYGDRDIADEIRTFTSRYRQQAAGSGPFGDVRQWNGAAHGFPGLTRWVRHSSAGTVAAPGSSNHGKKRSGDLAYPYNSNTTAHRRAQQLAKRHNITCEGLSFGANVEWWHWTYWGPIGALTDAGTPASTHTPVNTATDDSPRRGIKMDLILLLIKPRDGGLRRYLIDVRQEAHREISSRKYDIYKNAGMPTLHGEQPWTDIPNEFAKSF